MTNRIKLLYALESAGGGTLKHVVYLATRLNPERFEITVVLPEEKYEKDTEAAVVWMRQKGVCVDIIRMNQRISLNDIVSLYKIYRYLQKQKFDVVHAHSSKAGALFRIAAHWAKTRVVVYTPHCFYFNARKGLSRKFYTGIERFLARMTHAIVVSGPEQESLQSERIVPLKEVAVIDNAIDPNDYPIIDSHRLRCSGNISEDQIVVIGVGRLVKQKNCFGRCGKNIAD